MEFDFEGMVVLVTGGSRGIGRAVCRAFADNGAEVIVHYGSNEAAARETLNGLEGSGHMMVKADMADPVDLQDMVSEVLEQKGRIDVLVNNAGIFEEAPVEACDYELWQDNWQRTIHVNLIGAANLIHQVVPSMREVGGGRIINVSSRGAFRGEPEAPSYGASKAGMNSMSQSLARALAPFNIFVYAVAPGFVETDMVADMLLGEPGDAIRNQSPLGRVARPEEVAHTVLFLASKGAEFLTGGIVDVNGASYLRS